MTAVPPLLARVLALLDCVAAEQRLGGLLLFDLEPSLLPLLGRVLADRLGSRGREDGVGHRVGGQADGLQGDAATGRDPMAPVVVLGAWTTAESLWLRTAPAAHGFVLEPGVLVERQDDRPPPVVLVPDLEHAPLPVVHAALALLDSDAASVERLGHSLRWEPRARWLAALPRAAAGRLSPHLLDRFPLRVDAGGLAEALSALRAATGAKDDTTDASGTVDDAALLRTALPPPGRGGRPARLTSEAAALVVSLMPDSPGRRRDLALARTARALASGAESISPEHVREAARLFGLTQPQAEPLPAAAPAPGSLPVDPAEPAAPAAATPPLTIDTIGDRSAVAASEPRPLDAEQVPLPGPATGSLYPEDDPSALAPFASLRSAHRRPFADRPTGGQRIGVRPARDLHDLALVPTLLEAAKFQTVRRPPDRKGGRAGERHDAPAGRPALTVSAADLRQYRHARDSGRTLILVLDHSCRAGWDLGPALAPFLRWAYRYDAAVTVVEFGHRGASNEPAAERYRATSLLDPRIPASIGRTPGLASPLAHALDLAAQELRRSNRRFRGSHHEAVLVVVTDGRGNVPFNASLLGRVAARVGREGVTDALTAARAVRRIAAARTVLITPESGLYPELAFDLAESLGAELLLVPVGQAGGAPAGTGSSNDQPPVPPTPYESPSGVARPAPDTGQPR
ncbi:hypothetical protein ACFWOG_03495 [Kitasatospora sp. NPDC058406]|uniref:hypothetical protein n=1 Tax=Kitasatospora sp. NPDC058406 TaxID=3346483 RepID=UPI00365EA0FB